MVTSAAIRSAPAASSAGLLASIEATAAVVVLAAPTISRSHGGTAYALADFAGALAAGGHEVHLLTADRRPPALAGELDPRVRFNACGYVGPRAFRYSPAMLRQLDDLAQRDRGECVLCGEGLWMYPTAAASGIARKRGVPVVITPHGMAEPWAMRHRPLRKRLAGAIYQRRDLARSSCIRVLRDSEADALRDMGLTTPIAVIPNGVHCPADVPDNPVLADGLVQRHPELVGKRLLTHLGRVHPVKGLCRAVRALAQVAGSFDDWHFVIAGPDCAGHAQTVRAQAMEFGLGDRVSLIGPIHGADKASLLAATDLFCLASETEAMSGSLLEAMAFGKAVLITKGCAFEEVQEAGAGVVVESADGALAAGMRYLLGAGQDVRRQLGAAGRALVRRKYSWSATAGRMNELMGYLLGRSERPGFVIGR